MLSESTRTCANLLDAAELLRLVQRSLDLSAAGPEGPDTEAGPSFRAGLGERDRDVLHVLRRNKVPLLSLAADAHAGEGLLPGEGKDGAGTIPRPGEVAAHQGLALLRSAEFRTALEEDRAAYAQFHGEYVQLAQAWAQAGVRCMCFKSAGIAPSFPYTSDNVDVLVPAQSVAEARRILLDLGYVEMTNTEEPLKWLFRRFKAGRNVSLIHLHARVGWEAGFMLEDEIWARARPSADDPWTWVPGREDAVLINVAHALIENKALSLHDLVKIRYALSGGAIDWTYLDRVAAERGWRDCLHLGLLLVAHLEEQFCLRSTVPPEQRARFGRTLQDTLWLGRYWTTLQSHPPTLPFKISFTVSKALFFEKLWWDRQVAASHKPAQTVRALAHGIKQKGRLHLQNSMLITLSGIDGSGKSSQAQALHDACAVSHVHARIAWTRIGDTPLLRRLRRTRHRFAQRHGVAAPRTFRRTGWRLVLWAVLASVDYAAWLQSVRWRLWRGDVVIADRYLCDFEVELSIRLQKEQRLAALLLRALHALAPKPRRAYLLRLDPTLSRHRKPASDCRNLDPADLQARYDALLGRYGLRVYDASLPFEELASALVHDALSAYMATFGPLLRSLFFENPWQLNPPARRPPHTQPGRGQCTMR